MNNQTWIDLIRDIPDFPEPGVVFKDITPLIGSPGGFGAVINELATNVPNDIDVVVGMEARGFIFGAPVALSLGTGFVPVRKPGKLPGEVITTEYELEYGTNSLSVHRDAVGDGARVLIVDDILATGGTVAATAKLIKELGADLVAVAVVMELDFLNGRKYLSEQGIDEVIALTHVEG
ncbi:adenine phosphoribosyltransferase [Microlunatus sp. Gsoil 973]|uniref:adenine phosphoribosyltransferase n=1 Tax=Microlunatus sp. Gsoil 973 TaxID=2672569 RepID=UPI0012B48A5A|nr:adenine phosphoribosyltransferase [Microlunatus sp. Gsoil 973]QGN32700.1 adenine phosphoribosyltransferase [Microlunatus sp. Gsoil 973]